MTKVRGYACAERRTTVGTEISANVTCVRKKRKVTFAYRQSG